MSRYLVLDGSVGPKHVEHMIGRVVVDKTDPLKKYRPREVGVAVKDRFNPEDILPEGTKLYDSEPATYTDVDWVISKGDTKDVRAKLTTFIHAFAQKNITKGYRIEATEVCRYNMTSLEDTFQNLCELKSEYAAQIRELLAGGDEAWLVTGMLTCKHVLASDSTHKDVGAGGGAKVNLEPVGAPPGTKVEVAAKVVKQSDTSGRARIESERIFSLAYNQIVLERAEKKTMKFPLCFSRKGKTRLVLGDAARGLGYNIYLSGSDADRLADGFEIGDELRREGEPENHNEEKCTGKAEE